MSTVFGESEKHYTPLLYDEDDDPVLDHLRILDYRYMRFSFHPLKDRFVLTNSWKDPLWTDVKAIRAGIDGDEKDNRELVFGMNLIDIKQKTIPQLLVDEVCIKFFGLVDAYCSQLQAFHPFYVFQIASLVLWSLDEYYYYAACIFLISVVSITTTLIETRSVSNTTQ